MGKLTITDLQQMKRNGEKIFAAICYDHEMARIAEMAGADMLTVGDSVGHNMWGFPTQYDVTMDQMVLVCGAVARGAQRAVVTCDMPFGPAQMGVQEGLEAAIRLVKEGNAEMVKVDNAIANLDLVKAIVKAGIPVFPQFGFSPQASMAIGDFMNRSEDAVRQRKTQLVEEAKLLESLGAALLDCTGITSDVYGAISAAVSIPVLGGAATHEADGKISGFSYRSTMVNHPIPGRPNVAQYVYDTATAYIKEVKAGNY
ncbi:MAG: 3-methyl-2-oxobutanoate hydroxymethyltransferase [Chloroflexota bacterium]|jgi:3-methyl-2-oxobutanoate hydroxymethyltransferase|nr:3-methyl-2-oxobutanoate hydroxymethyltransferase [Chloroflexota bacterium]